MLRMQDRCQGVAAPGEEREIHLQGVWASCGHGEQSVPADKGVAALREPWNRPCADQIYSSADYMDSPESSGEVPREIGRSPNSADPSLPPGRRVGDRASRARPPSAGWVAVGGDLAGHRHLERPPGPFVECEPLLPCDSRRRGIMLEDDPAVRHFHRGVQDVAPVPRHHDSQGSVMRIEGEGREDAALAARSTAARFARGVRSGTAHSGPTTRTPASTA